MALALKRSAYSTNIKTRARLLVRVLRRAAALGRAGVLAAGAPRLDGRAGAEGGAQLRRREPRRRRRARHERPAPERRPPERRQPDLARPPRGRADRLRREPRAPRRRRRRRARVDRGVQGGLPGGRDHPAGQARRGRRDRQGRLQADPGPDPLEARDGGRLPRPDRRERDRRAPRARRSSSGTGATRSSRRWRSCSSTPSGARGPSSPRCRTASTRPRASVDNDGYTDEPVRPAGARRDRRRTASAST